MRFAWLREESGTTVSVEQSPIRRLVFLIYNVGWWIPLLLAILGTVDYDTAFVAFFVYTLFRAVADFDRNNFLRPEQAEVFPLRSPCMARR